MSMMTMFVQAITTVPSQPPNLPSATPNVISQSRAADRMQSGSIYLDKNILLTVIVLFFGLLALVLLYKLADHQRDEQFKQSELRRFELQIFTITILVFGSLLVAAAGFGSDQLTPVIGFFGTIAGYVLGRGDRPHDTTQ